MNNKRLTNSELDSYFNYVKKELDRIQSDINEKIKQKRINKIKIVLDE